ncbi:MAG: hypothetical protein R3C02_15415 [Planctomycetaceae bacterium]
MAQNKAYRRAKEIEDAGDQAQKELVLSGMQLTELPEWLGRLTQLQSLDLSGNRLTAARVAGPAHAVAVAGSLPQPTEGAAGVAL